VNFKKKESRVVRKIIIIRRKPSAIGQNESWLLEKLRMFAKWDRRTIWGGRHEEGGDEGVN